MNHLARITQNMDKPQWKRSTLHYYNCNNINNDNKDNNTKKFFYYFIYYIIIRLHFQ